MSHPPIKPGARKKTAEQQALTSEQIEELLNELDTRVDRIRALYDMYFIGIEKLEPHVQKKDVERRIHSLRKEQIRNTGLRFRFNMLVQRFNTMQTYWVRVSRAIEEGRYRRDVLKARERMAESRKKRRSATSLPPPEPDERRSSVPPEPVTLEEVAAATSPLAPSSGPPPIPRPRPRLGAVPPAPPPQVRASALSEHRLREIYDRYIEVRRSCGETVHNVPFERMATTLRGMEPNLRQKAGGRPVDFEVSVKDGRAFLKPIAR